MSCVHGFFASSVLQVQIGERSGGRIENEFLRGELQMTILEDIKNVSRSVWDTVNMCVGELITMISVSKVLDDLILSAAKDS